MKQRRAETGEGLRGYSKRKKEISKENKAERCVKKKKMKKRKKISTIF